MIELHAYIFKEMKISQNKNYIFINNNLILTSFDRSYCTNNLFIYKLLYCKNTVFRKIFELKKKSET